MSAKSYRLDARPDDLPVVDHSKIISCYRSRCGEQLAPNPDKGGSLCKMQNDAQYEAVAFQTRMLVEHCSSHCSAL